MVILICRHLALEIENAKVVKNPCREKGPITCKCCQYQVAAKKVAMNCIGIKASTGHQRQVMYPIDMDDPNICIVKGVVPWRSIVCSTARAILQQGRVQVPC
jgi:hypothetical protein